MILKKRTDAERTRARKLKWLHEAITHKTHFAWLPKTLSNGKVIWFEEYFSLAGGVCFHGNSSMQTPTLNNLGRHSQGPSYYRNYFECDTYQNFRLDVFGKCLTGMEAYAVAKQVIDDSEIL